MSQIIEIFEAKDYSEEDPEVGLKVMSLVNEVSTSPSCARIDNVTSAWNRCKKTVHPQQKSWASFHRGWPWGQTGFHNFQRSVE